PARTKSWPTKSLYELPSSFSALKPLLPQRLGYRLHCVRDRNRERERVEFTKIEMGGGALRPYQLTCKAIRDNAYGGPMLELSIELTIQLFVNLMGLSLSIFKIIDTFNDLIRKRVPFPKERKSI
ncbi:hypothetical protein HID58_015692, partial [Brassica napus]